jgi:hypothetical protein
MKERENPYVTDGVPNQGKHLPDGTHWTLSSAEVGEKSGRHICVETRRFGSNQYSRWQYVGRNIS